MQQYHRIGPQYKRKCNRNSNKHLSVEIQRTWNVKFFHAPVITGAIGIVTNELKK